MLQAKVVCSKTRALGDSEQLTFAASAYVATSGISARALLVVDGVLFWFPSTSGTLCSSVIFGNAGWAMLRLGPCLRGIKLASVAIVSARTARVLSMGVGQSVRRWSEAFLALNRVRVSTPGRQEAVSTRSLASDVAMAVSSPSVMTFIVSIGEGGESEVWPVRDNSSKFGARGAEGIVALLGAEGRGDWFVWNVADTAED